MFWSRVFCLIISLPSLGIPQQQAKAVHVVRASGEATVTVKPDRARISIGVVTQAVTAQDASSQNAVDATQVLNAIKQILGGAGEVKTTGYSVGPDYQYSKNGAPARITGYHANNVVLVTIDDLPLVAKVMDAAAKSGANRITGISFMLRNDETVRGQALAEASLKARAAAEAIAKALDLHVVGVLQAESGDTGLPQPLSAGFPSMAQSVQVAPPIEAGTIDIHATVVVTLEVR